MAPRNTTYAERLVFRSVLLCICLYSFRFELAAIGAVWLGFHYLG